MLLGTDRFSIRYLDMNMHAIWLGPRMMPLAQACLDDWRKQHFQVRLWTDQDPEIQEWIHGNRFAAECFRRKLYAFVSDYLRLRILKEYGGLYLDTDVTIRRDPSALFDGLHFSAGYESAALVGTAILFAEKRSAILERLLAFYEQDIWKTDLYIGPAILSKVLQERSWHEQEPFRIYPQSFFYAYQGEPLNFECPNESYLVHWFQHSWKGFDGKLFLKSKHCGFWGKAYIWQKYLFQGKL